MTVKDVIGGFREGAEKMPSVMPMQMNFFRKLSV